MVGMEEGLQRGYNPASRFLGDMGNVATMREVVFAQPPDPFVDQEVGFDINDRVKSAQFGDGLVVDIDGLAVTIQFDSGQTKKLNVEYARLQKS